jgi:hypothetical protein
VYQNTPSTHTSRTRWPPIKGSPPFPARAHCPAGPPLTPSRRTCFPASSRRRPRLPSYPPDLPRARTTTCSSVLHQYSSDFEPRRPCRFGHAGATCWSHLRLSHHRQSLPGESNCTPMPRVDLPLPWIATSELTPAGEGTVVNRRGIFVNPETKL